MEVLEMLETKKGLIITSIAAIGFGSTTIFAQIAYNLGANLMTLLALRFGMASFLFLLALKVAKINWNLTFRQMSTLMGLGFTGYAVFTTLYFYGVSLIPASLAGFLLASYPIFVSLISYITGDETMTYHKMLALLISISGLILVLGPAFEEVDAYGVVAVLLAASMYSIYVVGSNRILKEVHWLPGSTVITVSAAAFFLIGGALTGDLTLSVNEGVWYSAMGLALLSTFIAIGGFYLGLCKIGPIKASIVSTLEPLVTAVLASILFREQLTLGQLMGGGLILFAIIILQDARRRKDHVPTFFKLRKLFKY